VVDYLVVQCGNVSLVDLHDSARHSLVEAALPKFLFGQVPTIQRRTHIPRSTTDSRIEHLGTRFGVKVQVTVADDSCMRLRWLGGLGWDDGRGTADGLPKIQWTRRRLRPAPSNSSGLTPPKWL